MSEPTPACPDRVAVISDVHLDWRRRWQRRLESLKPLWAGARTVVFNGDTLDRTTAAHPDRAPELLDAIGRFCRADGVEPVFVAGNTDFEALDRDYLTLADGAVVVTHGHVLFPGICPWRSNADSLARARQAALAATPPAQRETLPGQLDAVRRAMFRGQNPIDLDRANRRPLLQQLWLFARRPDLLATVVRAWRDTPRLGEAFMDRYCPQGRAILIGHTHRPGVWRLGRRWIINTGSVRSPWRPLVAWVEGGTITVRRVIGGGEGLRPGKTVAVVAV